MCKYCERNESISRSNKSGRNYTIWSDVEIKPQKMIISTSVDRFTDADRYYDSWDWM